MLLHLRGARGQPQRLLELGLKSHELTDVSVGLLDLRCDPKFPVALIRPLLTTVLVSALIFPDSAVLCCSWLIAGDYLPDLDGFAASSVRERSCLCCSEPFDSSSRCYGDTTWLV